jgi:hypothetical protein
MTLKDLHSQRGSVKGHERSLSLVVAPYLKMLKVVLVVVRAVRHGCECLHRVGPVCKMVAKKSSMDCQNLCPVVSLVKTVFQGVVELMQSRASNYQLLHNTDGFVVSGVGFVE